MKILFCAEFFHPSVGGVQEVVRQLSSRLVKLGNDVTVATSFLPDRKFEIYDGVKIKSFSVSGNLVTGFSGDLEEYKNFVLNSDFDILFIYASQQWTFDGLWEILPLLSMHKVLVPCGYSAMFSPSYEEYFVQLPQILKLFDVLIYHAKAYRDYEFGQKHGLEHLAVLIPNGADAREFSVEANPDFKKNYFIDDDTFVILTVGSLNGAKGHLEVARAFEKIKLNKDKAILLLNGNEMPSTLNISLTRNNIQRLVNYVKKNKVDLILKRLILTLLCRLGLKHDYYANLNLYSKKINKTSNKKVLHCDLQREDLVQAFINADLFVFASNIEYSPLVLYEACAAGLPFLSVSVGNAKEIADWTSGGKVIDVAPDNDGMVRVAPELLAEEIDKLIADKDKLREMGLVGRNSVENRFNWTSLTKEYLRVFQELEIKGKNVQN